MMYFSSFSELLAMGGHGVFVWSAYGITFGAIIGAMIGVRLRRQSLKQQYQALWQNPTPADSPSALPSEEMPS